MVEAGKAAKQRYGEIKARWLFALSELALAVWLAAIPMLYQIDPSLSTESPLFAEHRYWILAAWVAGISLFFLLARVRHAKVGELRSTTGCDQQLCRFSPAPSEVQTAVPPREFEARQMWTHSTLSLLQVEMNAIIQFLAAVQQIDELNELFTTADHSAAVAEVEGFEGKGNIGSEDESAFDARAYVADNGGLFLLLGWGSDLTIVEENIAVILPRDLASEDVLPTVRRTELLKKLELSFIVNSATGARYAGAPPLELIRCLPMDGVGASYMWQAVVPWPGRRSSTGMLILVTHSERDPLEFEQTEVRKLVQTIAESLRYSVRQYIELKQGASIDLRDRDAQPEAMEASSVD